MGPPASAGTNSRNAPTARPRNSVLITLSVTHSAIADRDRDQAGSRTGMVITAHPGSRERRLRRRTARSGASATVDWRCGRFWLALCDGNHRHRRRRDRRRPRHSGQALLLLEGLSRRRGAVVQRVPRDLILVGTSGGPPLGSWAGIVTVLTGLLLIAV